MASRSQTAISVADFPQSVRIRHVAISDAPVLATLAGELGYPATAKQMERRLGIVTASPLHRVFVAEKQRIHGWIHVALVHSLETEPYAEIIGLVVSEDHRGSGVGTLLVQEAERWAEQRHVQRIRVRTNVVRERALGFYKKLGYVRSKTQEVLDKPL